ncbi:MAG TPA: hypothetical protein VKJ65_12780, partial [Phycisphaerae bacterium]|nr:hypothetical protein [Phycisphaerae bacterium]
EREKIDAYGLNAREHTRNHQSKRQLSGNIRSGKGIFDLSDLSLGGDGVTAAKTFCRSIIQHS